MKLGSFLALAYALAAKVALAAGASITEADFCVYGGTSGGVAAAVQAARLGKKAVLVEFGQHLGGMTSGGLGWTDTGNRNTIGGISREFYQRAGQHYGTTVSYAFEPRVAEGIFKTMLLEQRVTVFYGQRLAGVTKQGNRIVEIRMENGNVFRAKMYLDATYEGDLMALAGVSYTVGREATNDFGETLNGIRPSTPSHQFVVNVDPYNIPNDSASGLLPYIQAGDGGPPGGGDRRVQAYNFRLCLTQTATNRLPIAPPGDYDEANYELLGRYLDARVNRGDSLNLRSFLKIDNLPNGKTDINNQGAFSTDFIGMNYTYPTNTYAERARIWKAHEDYIRGFLTYLATNPRVPANVRAEMQSWGLCRDEFQDTGGWPHQMYVREARRMVSDYFIVQDDCDWRRVAPDSVGLASYNMDSHNCQRVVQNGVVRNEGDVQRAPAGPFPISYRAIVPRQSECDNLLVTFCLSGSHIAFSSCRMEPVFMITSQSAATAASLAIDDNVAVQQVDYAKLSLQLRADGQVLTWNTGSTIPTNGIVADNADADGVTIVGDWTISSSTAGFQGPNYLHDGDVLKGSKSVRLTPNLPHSGLYDVFLRWPAHANRGTNVPIDIVHANGVETRLVNQRENGAAWNLLLATNFNAGTNGSVVVRNNDPSGYVIADAALFVPAGGSAPDTTVDILATDPAAGEWPPNPGRFTVVRSGPTNVALAVNLTISGTATSGTDYPLLPSAIILGADSASTNLDVLPVKDQELEPAETVVVSIAEGNGYLAGNYPSAIVAIRDVPLHEWQSSQFSTEELANPNVSGEDADPDQDGIPNSREYALGLNAKSSETGDDRPLRAGFDQGVFFITHTQRRNAPDVAVILEVSSDLIQWKAAARDMIQTELTDDGDRQILTFREPFPGGSPGAAYYRLRIAPY